MRRIVPLLMGIGLLASCSHAAPSPATSGSGVRGTVVVQPGCPVERIGSPCPDRPWQGTVRAMTPQGDTVRDVHTDAQGVFELPLDPGTYIIAPQSLVGLPKSKQVTVTADRFTSVTLYVDIGIR